MSARKSAEPLEVALCKWQIETKPLANGRNHVRRCRLPQNGSRNIAREDFRRREYEKRCREKGQYPEESPPQDYMREVGHSELQSAAPQQPPRLAAVPATHVKARATRPAKASFRSTGVDAT